MIHWAWLAVAFLAGLLAGGVVMALAAAGKLNQHGSSEKTDCLL